MLDFIKRLFSGKQHHCAQPHDVAALDVVEGNDIEILKTSEYREGIPADAIEQFVAEQELPPPELDLPMAELDEPSDEPDMPAEVEEKSDNYLLGDLKAARKQRDMQTRKAGMQFWNDGMMKYRPRSARPAVEGKNAKQFNYFEVLRDEPMLRQVELQHPGMSIEHLKLNKFMHNSLKGKMVSDYVLRSMKLIRDQQDNGMPPVRTGTAGGTEMRDAHNKTLRDMFNAFEFQRLAESQTLKESQSITDSHVDKNEHDSADVEELLHHFEDLFQPTKEDNNKDSYTRWLLSVAEEASATPDILWLLVEDPNPDVRFCLAESYNIDADMLKMLSEDENPYVAHRAQKTLMRINSSAGQVIDRDFGGGGEINRFRRSS